MEVRRVEGRKLIENIVYNIYENEGNGNVGVCLVISENNINNRTKIKLRKLIGNDELSLNKSEIYGKIPVNLTGANLTGLDLADAILTDANLTGANLTGATLTDADLTNADLTGVNLTGATLTDANISFSNLTLSNLTDANLTRVILSLTNLTDANLIGAILTDSELVQATLTGAIISRNSISENNKETIFGQPKYIEELNEEQLRQEILRQEQRRQELIRQQRRNLNNNNSHSSSSSSNSNHNRSSNNTNNNNINNISNLQSLTRQELIELVIRRPIQNTNSASNYISQVQRFTRQELIELLTRRQQRAIQRPPIQRRLFNSNNDNNSNSNSNSNSNTTFDGNNLVENCVYNIYKNEGNVNVGVCLVISENNRNNGTKIKLRKLIGSNELSLIKSEIYGKIPVNLRNTNLSDAVLTDADLTGADLTDANLIGAFLIGAFLTGAFLIDSDLTNAELTYADLTDANLTGATLTGANLNNAIIFRDSLSALQKQQIIGQPNYIERVRRIQLQRPFGPEERIKIPENLINPVKKSNNSCPNFNGLYEFIMRQNLSGMFFFIYEGPNRKVIDFGGATRDVFDKILPAYTKKFFKEIEDNEDYVILKESVDMDTLIRETDQLILLASASETKIFLKIDPTLLSLLVETEVFKKYFTNNKRNRFSELYAEFNQYIEENSNNNDRLLKHPNNKRELMKTLKNQALKNEKLKIELEQEIRFRIFAIKCGFTNIKQFINMSNFITVFYNIPNRFITCKLKFDRETFVKRIKLFKKIKINKFEDYTEEPIPLEQYVRLSQNNQSILILNRANDIIMNYPYLIPFLNFIFGPESSDDDRKLFVLYVSGSSSYTGELNIYLSYITHVKAGNIPYKSTTCEKYLELFKNKTQNRHPITVELIRQQLFSDTGFGRA